METSPFECVLDAKAAVGECPTWHRDEALLYWIDSPAGRLNRFDPTSGENRANEMGFHIGSFAFRQGQGLVAATQRGFGFLDPETGAFTIIADPEVDRIDAVMNDGRAGPGGQFFTGSMGFPIRLDRTDNTFWRFDPDGRMLYHADSLPSVQTIWVRDHDPTSGAIENHRVFATTHDLPGRPDGACVDADGFYWSANVDGWQVVRYDPKGRIERTIPIPVQKPSMPCFGGPDLDTLYVTSIGNGGTSTMAEGQPQAGGLFACQSGGKGRPEPLFAG